MSDSRPPIALLTDSFPILGKALETEFLVVSEEDDPAKVRGVVVAASEGATPEQLDRYPNLEIVAVYGVGVDGLERQHLIARELVLANTPGVLDDAVAEHAMALMLTAARRVREADDFVREGEWGQAIFPLARGLKGKRCGIVGLGRIGHKIARLAEAFGLTIAYHGRHHQKDVIYEYFDDLWALATESDVLVLALPGGSETEGIVGQEVLRALGPEGLLVNVARGSVVDDDALVEALEFGDLGGAALDVFSTEPKVPEALLALPNVVLTPHIASATEEARGAMVDFTLENLRAHFSQQTVPGQCRLF